MGITRWWPIALAVFIPGIVLLYLLKQKVREQKISALNLWKEAYENIQANTPWEKFRNNLLMYMQIAALIIIIVALMSPYLTGSDSGYDDIIIMIDNSGSMSGIYSDGITKLDEAKKQASDYINSGIDARFSVVSSNGYANLEISGETDKRQVIDAVNNIFETHREGALDTSVSMVQSLVSGMKDYKVLAFTDESVNMQELNCEVIDLSVSGENSALHSVSHSVGEDGTVKVLAYIANYGRSKLITDVNLYLGDKLYDIQTVEADSGKDAVVYFKDIPVGRYKSVLNSDKPYLMAEINSNDMLMADNSSYDILAGTDNQKILLVTEKNSFLENALTLGSTQVMLDKVKAEDADNLNMSGEGYSLVVYDGEVPSQLPQGSNIIFVNPKLSKNTKGWQKDIFLYKENENNVLVKTKSSKVTEYIEDYSFSCMKAKEFELPSWAYSFFETSSKNTTGYCGYYGGRKIAVIGFDLHNTDFPLQTEFPIFMFNLLKETMTADIFEKNVYNAGEMVVLNRVGDAKEIVVTDTAGKKEQYTFEEDTFIYDNTNYSGLYSVKEGKNSMYFSVTFPERESNISEKAVVTAAKKDVQVSKHINGKVSKRTYLIPILLILTALLMAEWRVYRKKL